MTLLDPEPLFHRLAKDIPTDLHEHVFVVGSLAAAYHFRLELQGRGVNTKDADLVVHPAGHTVSCAEIAGRLLDLGWRRHPDCFPSDVAAPADDLRAIRLYPPEGTDYFVEFLNLPELGQEEIKTWVPVEVRGGWYGLPTFKYQGLCAQGRLRSASGLEYASPAMMALPNLLSHPTIRPQRTSLPIGGRRVLRSGKDLGRVLALAQLSSRDEVEAWLPPWLDGLQTCFPTAWREVALTADLGLRALLVHDDALQDALHTCEVGLLRGRGASKDTLRAIGDQLLLDVIEPLADAARATRS